MKSCTKCSEEKPFTEFSPRKGKSLYNSWCKDCVRTHNRIKYKSSPEDRQRIRRNHKNSSARNKDYWRSYLKDKSCLHCGFNNPVALDFHHLDPKDKKNSVAVLKNNSYSIETIEKEMSKCIILCANCHRIEHSKV